ncbi:hypothetical protein FSARC_6592 [Fusarium sarcochroum]|uniref:AAA+ ATPase domain-containing protein n=1 Tax=Fusarium sarcochroum TaxID=1208366 RepID=A0A8H4TX79_9HYPO|nr:hypothetical protein FSARC_6592 [Fusarium sarcochroum]
MASNNSSGMAEASTGPVPQGSIPDFKTYRSTKKKDGRTNVDEEPDAFHSSAEPKLGADNPYALINSPQLLQAFREVIKSYPTVAADFNQSFQLKSPFQMLIHNWDPLDAYRKETESPVMRLHLNLLFQFMEREIGPDRKAAITYETSSSRGPYLTVSAKFCDANDGRIGEVNTSFSIYQKVHFASDHPAQVRALPVYPREYHSRGQDLEEELLARGKKFIANRGVLTRDYDGLAQYMKERPWDYYSPDMAEESAVWLPFTETGRIVLDRKTFEEDNFGSTTSIRKSEHPEIMLCPPYSLGFSMDRKEWCRYLVDNIREVAWKDNAWPSLILEQTQKSVLEALVKSHKYPENTRNQPEQKGKGLVILLHGTPGSGKTLSAETSAEMSKKALLSTSLGELNTSNVPWLFERRLKQLLQYATIWQAIVLLDEADVFLEARENSSSNATRNALVAVFLKQLEYFSGIVFLTTNRLASFDEAMKSRIHLSLRFEAPDLDTRRRIWRQNLEAVPLDETEIGGAESDDATDSLVCYDLNGREISNALNTARTLARFERVKLNHSHIEKVLEVGQTFDRHLKEESRRLVEASYAGGDRANRFNLIKRNSVLSKYAED